DGRPANPPLVWEESWYSFWMIRERVVNIVGLFDTRLAYRFHDQDYSIRLKKAGFKVLRTSAVRVQHDEASTYRKMNLSEVEAKERETMINRYGVEHFRDWGG